MDGPTTAEELFVVVRKGEGVEGPALAGRSGMVTRVEERLGFFFDPDTLVLSLWITLFLRCGVLAVESGVAATGAGVGGALEDDSPL